MPEARNLLSLLALIAVIALWFFVNRHLYWPVHPVLSVVWAASALHLGVSMILGQRPSPITLWSDLMILMAGVAVTTYRFVRAQ